MTGREIYEGAHTRRRNYVNNMLDSGMAGSLLRRGGNMSEDSRARHSMRAGSIAAYDTLNLMLREAPSEFKALKPLQKVFDLASKRYANKAKEVSAEFYETGNENPPNAVRIVEPLLKRDEMTTTKMQAIREKLPNVTREQLGYGSAYVVAQAAEVALGSGHYDRKSFKSLSTGRKVGSAAIGMAAGVVPDTSFKKLKGTLGERGKVAADAVAQSIWTARGAVGVAQSIRKKSYGMAALGAGATAVAGVMAVSNLKILMRTESDSDAEKALGERDARIINFGRREATPKKSHFRDFEELDRWFMNRDRRF